MSKILKVVKPFFIMEAGDTFELSADEKEYVSAISMEHHEDDEERSMVSSYNAKYSISKEYAENLIAEGFLVEDAPAQDKKFVNVFDEIADLRKEYKEELAAIDDEMANMPACMKVEKETVLTNLINVLDYLNSLKK